MFIGMLALILVEAQVVKDLMCYFNKSKDLIRCMRYTIVAIFGTCSLALLCVTVLGANVLIVWNDLPMSDLIIVLIGIIYCGYSIGAVIVWGDFWRKYSIATRCESKGEMTMVDRVFDGIWIMLTGLIITIWAVNVLRLWDTVMIFEILSLPHLALILYWLKSVSKSIRTGEQTQIGRVLILGASTVVLMFMLSSCTLIALIALIVYGVIWIGLCCVSSWMMLRLTPSVEHWRVNGDPRADS